MEGPVLLAPERMMHVMHLLDKSMQVYYTYIVLGENFFSGKISDVGKDVDL